MLDEILKLKGVVELSKNQKKIFLGRGPEECELGTVWDNCTKNCVPATDYDPLPFC